MKIKDLIPWGRDSKPAPKGNDENENSLIKLQRDMIRVFEDFWNRFDQPSVRSNGLMFNHIPKVDVTDSDSEVEITADLPGMDEKDIEVNVTEDILTIRGETTVENENKKKGYYVSERSYGVFHRMIPLPPGVDTNKANAIFEKGVLTISVPKTPEAKAKVKRVEVQRV